jgi:uncharacterized protein (DUF1330 family)
MAAYLVANLQITDPEKFAEYRDRVAPVIAHHGGNYLIRGGAVTALEGDPALHRVVVIAFPDMAALRGFYDSADYAPLIRLRQSASTGTVAIIEGYAPA